MHYYYWRYPPITQFSKCLFPSLCFLQCSRDTVSTVHYIWYLICKLVLQGQRSVFSSLIASNVLMWDIKRLSAWCINLNGVIRCIFLTQSYRSLMFLFDLCQYLKHEYHQTLNSSRKNIIRRKRNMREWYEFSIIRINKR